jgi:hypothetical protein
MWGILQTVVITQKKAYGIQNTAKVWNQEHCSYLLSSLSRSGSWLSKPRASETNAGYSKSHVTASCRDLMPSISQRGLQSHWCSNLQHHRSKILNNYIKTLLNCCQLHFTIDIFHLLELGLHPVAVIQYTPISQRELLSHWCSNLQHHRSKKLNYIKKITWLLPITFYNLYDIFCLLQLGWHPVAAVHYACMYTQPTHRTTQWNKIHRMWHA